jgi:plasmid stability protein
MYINSVRKVTSMATLTIKDLDDWIYSRLRHRAKRNRRSIVAEAAMILEQALSDSGQSEEELLALTRTLRECSNAAISSHEELIRMRDEGRP